MDEDAESNGIVGSDEPEKKPEPKSVKKRLVVGGVGIAVIVATFVFVLPQIANYRSVWAVVKGLTWEQIGVLALSDGAEPRDLRPAVDGGAARAQVPPGVGADARLDRVHRHRAGGAAVGVAASYGVLRAWGFKGRPVTIARGHRGLEPVRDARVPDRRARDPEGETSVTACSTRWP